MAIYIFIIAVIIFIAACEIVSKIRIEPEMRMALEHIKEFRAFVAPFEQQYIDHRMYEKMISTWSNDYGILTKAALKIQSKPDVAYFLYKYHEINSNVDSMNETFVCAQMARCTDILHACTGKDLDEQQKRAVVTDEVSELVIAGAGSGKTLTIVAKVGYLVKVQGIDPERILLLAFNKKAADELSERLLKAGISVKAKTFHKFGLDTIIDIEHHRPDLADEALLKNTIRQYIKDLDPQDAKQQAVILEYFGIYSLLLSKEEDYSTIGEYYEHNKGMDFETLRSKYERNKSAQRKSFKGEQMRSVEETIIANFLFLHGVEYEYEKRYPFDDNDYRRTYHPDFYLPESDIYLEHFGINKDGELPWLSAVEAQKYKSDMVWKRDVHKKNGTKLIESYSYWKQEGKLIDNLDALLKRNGVMYHQIDLMEIIRAIAADDAADKTQEEAFKLMESFLRLYRENPNVTFDSLKRNVEKMPADYDKIRMQRFLAIVEPIESKYEQALRVGDKIDFCDMIARASQLILDRGTLDPYDYIIVDEFQDISCGRYRLLKTVQDKNASKVFCVGDDWQSIYRFTGCDVDYLVHFQKYFGYCKVLRIEKTYRYSSDLIHVVEPFILKNPTQLRKEMRSTSREDRPVRIYTYKDKPEDALTAVIGDIHSKYGDDRSVALLMRNNSDIKFLVESDSWTVLPAGEDKRRKCICERFPDVVISAATIHSSKGTEADNVVLIKCENGLLGLPNKMADDPILQLLLAGSEDYEFAEERRLFYVALTRTKHRAYILVPERAPSPFIQELVETAGSNVVVMKRSGAEEKVLCPVCRRGYLVRRTAEDGKSEFLGCSLYPFCRNTYNDLQILKHAIVCPKCGGYMVRRTGKNGAFIGCSNYPTCKMTASIMPKFDDD